jgi:hypothetical protein
VAAMLLQLHSGQQVVLKAWSEARANGGRQQVRAEIDAATKYAWTPVMLPLLGFAGHNTVSGGVSTVSRMGGDTLEKLMQSPAWKELPLQARVLLFQRVAGCICLALDEMRSGVGGLTTAMLCSWCTTALQPCLSCSCCFNCTLQHC